MKHLLALQLWEEVVVLPLKEDAEAGEEYLCVEVVVGTLGEGEDLAECLQGCELNWQRVLNLRG